DLAADLGIQAVSVEHMLSAVAESDIVIVAASASEPLVKPEHLTSSKRQWIIDLSIPNNVHPDVALLPGKQLLNVDELSRMKDETLQKRMAEVPKARAIIAEQSFEFLEWCRMRKQLAVLGEVKLKLEEIHHSSYSLSNRQPLFEYNSPVNTTLTDDPSARIQKVLNTMAAKMRVRNERGCHYLEAINDFIAV